MSSQLINKADNFKIGFRPRAITVDKKNNKNKTILGSINEESNYDENTIISNMNNTDKSSILIKS